MKLIELAYFTGNVGQMTGFYRGLLGTEPVARSDDMAIFMSGQTKIFIHRKYVPAEGECLLIITALLRWTRSVWMQHAMRYFNKV
jgi:hypothetical protein